MTTRASECQHGGAFWDRIGPRFDALARRHDVVNADVLDAWFDPAPGVLGALQADLPWLARTSPPTHAEGLRAAIAASRSVPLPCVAVGAGSSDLIYRAFGRWFGAATRAVLPDPIYGEYAHVLERGLGATVVRVPARRDAGFRLDLAALAAAARRERADLVVLVHPSNPTGQRASAAELAACLDALSPSTRVWVDETYVEYAGGELSLETRAAQSPGLVVCKSMSKVYALSGLRVGYLVAAAATVADLQQVTPPWPVSLPAQVAAVRALQERAHYQARWAETCALRADLARALAALGGTVYEGCINALLWDVPRPWTPAGLVAAAAARGVFVRDLSELSAVFAGRTVRLAVRSAAENARMLAVLRDAVASGPGLVAASAG